MGGWDLGLSPEFHLDVMAPYAVSVKRYGIWARGAAVIVILVAAGFVSPPWRTVQLLPLTVGFVLAWLDAYPPSSDAILGSRGLRHWVDARTTAVSKIATMNLAGLLEGFGVVAGGFLFAGPLPVSMPAGPRLAAAVALAVFCWDAFSQVVADPGYYNKGRPPQRWVIAVRWLLPLATAAAFFAVFASGAAGAEALRIPFWAAALLAGSFFLLWPYAGMLSLVLQYADSAASDQVSRNLGLQRLIDHEYVHRAKNELRPKDTLSDAEYYIYAAAVLTVANADRDIAASAFADYTEAHPADELWMTYQLTIGETILRDRLRFTDRTNGRKLSHMEGLILQGIFVGFVSNALRAHPEQIDVTVSDGRDDDGTPLILVVVDDDGAGGAPSAFRPGSGLARLSELCQMHGGSVHVEPRESGGTRATATFNCSYLFADEPGGTHDFQQEERTHGQIPGPGGRRWPIGNNGRRHLAAPRS